MLPEKIIYCTNKWVYNEYIWKHITSVYFIIWVYRKFPFWGFHHSRRRMQGCRGAVVSRSSYVKPQEEATGAGHRRRTFLFLLLRQDKLKICFSVKASREKDLWRILLCIFMDFLLQQQFHKHSSATPPFCRWEYCPSPGQHIHIFCFKTTLFNIVIEKKESEWSFKRSVLHSGDHREEMWIIVDYYNVD